MCWSWYFARTRTGRHALFNTFATGTLVMARLSVSFLRNGRIHRLQFIVSSVLFIICVTFLQSQSTVSSPTQACTQDYSLFNDQLPTVFFHTYVSPSLYSVDCRSMFTAGSLIRRPIYHQSHRNAFIALLLLMGNVEPNPGPQMINFGLMNARSSVNKAALIHDVISYHRLDIVAVTETGMLSDNSAAIKQDIAPVGYHVLHACRGSSADVHRGGGVAIIHRDSFNVSTVDLGCFTEFEYLSNQIKSTNINGRRLKPLCPHLNIY
jgi:hypothetical protein